MNAITTALLMVAAVALLSDTLCYGDFVSFLKGFFACNLVLRFFEDLDKY